MRADSPVHDPDVSAKDFKLMLSERENTGLHKEAERLVMTKDSGKQFMAAAPASGLGNFLHETAGALDAVLHVSPMSCADHVDTVCLPVHLSCSKLGTVRTHCSERNRNCPTALRRTRQLRPEVENFPISLTMQIISYSCNEW